MFVLIIRVTDSCTCANMLQSLIVLSHFNYCSLYVNKCLSLVYAV